MLPEVTRGAVGSTGTWCNEVHIDTSSARIRGIAASSLTRKYFPAVTRRVRGNSGRPISPTSTGHVYSEFTGGAGLNRNAGQLRENID